MLKFSWCFSNSFSESSAPLGRPPHFPFGISSASCSRWVNLSSQHPPIFNCTLPLMYIHKKDAIHASHRRGWMEAVFSDLHRHSWDMQNSSSERSERSARGKTKQDCDWAIEKLVVWVHLLFQLVRLLLKKNTEKLCQLLVSLLLTLKQLFSTSMRSDQNREVFCFTSESALF